MTCERVQIGEHVGIVCGVRRPKCKCGRRATRLCDWKVPTGTCDEPICNHCGVSPTPDKDICTRHAAAYETWRAQRR